MSIEAMKLALEAITKYLSECPDPSEEAVERLCDAASAARKAIAEAEKQGEPVGWPCLIAETNFSQNTVTLTMQCEDYKVSAEQHWLSTTPQQREWVGLTEEERREIYKWGPSPSDAVYLTETKLKQKNT
jgi:hypothetical protein